MDCLKRTLLHLNSKIAFVYYYIDIALEKISSDKNEVELQTMGTVETSYDLENDIIQINYTTDWTYTFFFERKMNTNISKLIDEFKLKEKDEYLIFAKLGNIDITDRLNKLIGPNAVHLKYNDIKICWFLTNKELLEFKELNITDGMGTDKIYESAYDYLKLDII